MQNARPDAPTLCSAGLKACLSDVSGSEALTGRVRDLLAALQIPLAGVEDSPFADVALVTVDIAEGFSPRARQCVAIARMSGMRHVLLAVGTHDGDDATAFKAISAAYADFAGKLELTTALAVPIAVAHTPEPGAWDSSAGLCEQLTELARHLPHSDIPPATTPLSEQFAAHIACVSEHDLLPGREYRLRLPGQETTASVTSVKYQLDLENLRRVPARTLSKDQIGVCTIATSEPLLLSGSIEAEDARFTLSDLYTDELIAAGSVDFALRRGMNIHWQPFSVGKSLRAAAKNQRACIVWFTGLSGAGKSTVANLVEGWLALQGRHTYILDGDNVRHGLNKDLGFTAADRVENIRRVGEVARLFVDAGIIVLCSFISPFRAERESVRSLVEPGEFIEIFVTAPLNVCEKRDPKGLYAKSRAGNLPNFTGIDSPYEAPEDPDLVLDTTSAPPTELAQRVVELLQERGVVSAPLDQVRAARGL